MGKRRHTAKTGDKALYKSRGSSSNNNNNNNNNNSKNNTSSTYNRKNKNDGPSSQTRRNDEDALAEDPVYDQIDHFHNSKGFVALNIENNTVAKDDASLEEEAVMDLAAGGDTSSSEEETEEPDDVAVSSSDDEEHEEMEEQNHDDQLVAEEDDMENDVILDEEEEEEVNIRDWGHKKSAYYHADTTDLEKGQEEDDAFDEEEAAKEVQRERFQKMADEDFMISDASSKSSDVEEDGMVPNHDTVESVTNASVVEIISKAKGVSTQKDRLKKLDQEHPEVLPLLHHFSDIAQNLQTTTMVASNAIFDGETDTAKSIGATPAGLLLLLNKAMVQTSTTLNLAVYMMLKREAVAQGQDPGILQTHPIMSHLQKMNTLLSQIEDVEMKHGIHEQLRNIVKASALLSGDAISCSEESNSSSDETASDDDEEDIQSKAKDNTETSGVMLEKVVDSSSDSSDDSSSMIDDDNASAAEAERSRLVLTEARFGLRPNEVVNNNNESTRKRRRTIMLDAGDDGDQVATINKSKKSSSLAGTLNSIEQRTATKTRKLMLATEEEVDDDTKIRRSLEMMEAELGPENDQDDKRGKESVDKPERQDGIEDGDDNQFYEKLSKRSKEHRDYKKKLHEVAPKFPRVDGMVQGERAANRHIIKNRGLVAHKKKINRNPRVKKREQFRKALIRRKGAVREVRKDEGHKYGGEETGIKTNLSRSRKLA